MHASTDEVVQKNGVMEGEAAGAKRASDLLVPIVGC
jgi:hypothetical protein